LLGAGRLGGALLEGWIGAHAFAPGDLDRSTGPEASAAAQARQYSGAC
jgi:pyrroline-5-carboxylate reductase